MSPIALFVRSFASALAQEKDTAAILLTAWQMNRQKLDMKNVDSSGRRWLMRVGARYKPLDNYLKQKGWQHFDQMGAIGIYKKNGQTMKVNFRMYTRKYMICQADRQP